MSSAIEIDVSANIAKFKASMDKASLEGQKLNKNLNKAFKGINTAMKSIGALAGVAVAGGMGAMAKKSIDAADAIQKLGVRTGASAEFLSEMRLAISQSDVSTTEFANSLTKLNKSSQDAADGLSTPKRAFEKLGISVSEFNKLNTDQKFTAISEAISKIQDPAAKSQIAMDLMGRSGSQLITVMEGGAAGLEEYRNKAIDLGQSLSQEMVDGAAAANDAVDLLGKSISGSFSQTILQYTDEIKAAADFTREYLPKAINALVEALKIAIPVVTTFYTTLALLKFAPPMFAAISASAIAMSGGLSVASVAMGTLAVSVNVLKAGLMFLTGPVGIALTIASLVGLALNFGETEKSTESLRAELALLKTGNNDLADSMSKVTMASVDQSIEALRKQYEGLNSDLKLNLITFGQFDERLAELDERSNVLIETKQELIGRINETREALSEGVTATRLSWKEWKKAQTALKGVGVEASKAASKVKSLSDLMPGFNRRLKDSNRVSDEASNILDDLVRKRGEFGAALESTSAQLEQTSRNQEKFNQAVDNGSLSGEQARIVAQQLGLDYEGLGNTAISATDSMSKAWDNFADGAYDSFKTFTRSALDGWDGIKDGFKNLGDSLKNLAKDIVADLIATFASNALKKVFANLFGGGGGTGSIFSGLGSLFGKSGGGGGGGGLGGIGSITGLISGVKTATSAIGGWLGIGSAALGTASAAGSAAVASSMAASASMAASMTSLGAGGAPATVAFGGHLGGGGISAAIGAIPGWGWAALAAAAVLAIGSGARTPQELGEDQLKAVDDATRAGRNTQVALGSVGGVATSFLGGFDENSTMWGVDLLKDELQKVGDVLKTKFGFNQALALKDGVIRLEDFSREFSANNEEIVAEVQASILIAKHAFDDAELAKVKSLGKSVIAMDRLYDQSADSGKSAADRLKEAYMGAFGASESAAMEALSSMGLETERLAQIFDLSSNEILATLTGVATDGLGLFGQSISEMGTQADLTFDQIEQRINGVSVAAQGGAGQVVDAYGGAYDRVQGLDDSFSRRLLQKLDQITDNSSVTRGSGQALAGI